VAPLVREFLRGRVVLKRCLVLIDSRHGVKDVDREMLDMLDGSAVGYRLVLTKADKIKASELDDVYARPLAEARKHSAAFPLVAVTSSETGWGLRNCGLRFLGMLSCKKVKGKMRAIAPRSR
jgi:GTP-binding protein